MSTPRPIGEVAAELGIPQEALFQYGPHVAKVDPNTGQGRKGAGRVVLVSAVTPTPAGEGKTTTSLALAMGMRKLGRRAVPCLRQPSLAPYFGRKGGGSGGGRARLEPQDLVDIHFTGDIHAVTAAHDQLAAFVDNAVHYRSAGAPDPRRISWRRVMDINDRALRNVVIGLGGSAHGVPRESGFDLTAASELMAILALADSSADLQERIARIVVGSTAGDEPVTAAGIGAVRALTQILAQASWPNLAQTSEGGPAFVHAGPFGNIAHGCSSVLATQLAARIADDVITEAGFAFDLGGEKFLDLKCRAAGIWPRAVVLVVTARAVDFHGGTDNLRHHIESVRAFGLEPIVAINRFPDDTPAQLAAIHSLCSSAGARSAEHFGFADGGAGTVELAKIVGEVIDATDAAPPAPKYSYPTGVPFKQAVAGVAARVYGTERVEYTAAANTAIDRFTKWGFGNLPPCIAKTHMSISDDPNLRGRPTDHVLHVREVRLSAGAGFLVALTGEVLTMPGLPKPGA